MKKLLTALLTMLMLFALAACGNSYEDETINTELVKKYSTGEKYYHDVYDNVEIEDFGTKYQVPLYDVIISNDELQFFYAYDGSDQNATGEKNRTDYLDYLAETFGLDETATENRGIFSYKIAEDKFVSIMKYQMQNDAGMMLVVTIPMQPQASSEASE